jgi:uncharacterized membrane protein
MKSLNKIMATGLGAEAIVLSSQVCQAGGWNQDNLTLTGVPTNLKSAITSITNWLLGFVAIIAVLIIIYGGLLYLTAAGSDTQVEKAKKTIFNGIIGLIIVGLAYAIVFLVTSTLISSGGDTGTGT